MAPPDPARLEAARAIALRMLAGSARSRAEIERRLERDEFPADVVAAVLEECAARGWLDDRKFARDWVEDRAGRKQYGRRRLEAELRRRGVDREAVDEALAEVRPDEERARALAAARSRLKGAPTDAASAMAERRRIAEFLQRRGFGWGTITEVLAELLPNSE